MVAYQVGAGDEEPDQTGLSHYLEHLLFKGTEKLMPGDIDRATQRSGGHNNAYTSEDMTVYHFDFAADRWTTALDIEADRMRNVRIDDRHEFQQEKGAVVAELEKNEDMPGDLENKTILPLLFPKGSPYAHPVIGERAHVRGATAEIIKRHYDKWYHPNNASLVVVGGFDPDDALARIERQLGTIPAADLPPRKAAPAAAARAGLVRKEIPSKFDAPRMLLGFNTVRLNEPADCVLDVIQNVLADGKTGRLYRRLVEDERIAISIGASNNAGRYPGWFSVNVEAIKGKDRARIEDMVLAELERLAAEPISDAELKRARKKILASFVFSRDGVHGLADSIAHGHPAGRGGRGVVFQSLPREDARRVQGGRAAGGEGVPGAQQGRCRLVRAEGGRRGRRGDGSMPAPAVPPAPRATRSRATFSFADAKRTVLPNGLTLLTMEDHRLPVVVCSAGVRDVRLREPAGKAGVAHMVGDLLEEGTAAHSGRDIATLIEDTGGSLGFSSSGGAFKVLTPDTDLALGLLFECLTKPTFPQAEFDRVKEQQLAGIDESESQPNTKASQLFHAAVYGSHPFARPSLGTKQTVGPLTAADCRAFHALAFLPNETLVTVVGDFDTADMVRKVTALTADWKKGDAARPQPPAPPRPETVRQTLVSDPTAAQVHVYIGGIGITRNNPDYYKLLVMDNVLGSGAGFTDRLSSTLRDRQGLAYTVGATITASAGEQPGLFSGYIGTFPDKFLWVREGFLKELNRIRDEPPTALEVEDAKKYLLGSLPFKFTSLSAVAGQLGDAERYGLGLDFPEQFRKAVEAVTPADVQAVARKYLDPKTLTIVAVGPIDQEGKALGKK